VQATLADTSSRTLAGQRVFRTSIPAAENQVGAIVDAFDRAVAQVTGELVNWVDDQGS
jgi:ABC-type uncharacterized transport system auxiliary subunit